jgi:hypothetical protein
MKDLCVRYGWSGNLVCHFSKGIHSMACTAPDKRDPHATWEEFAWVSSPLLFALLLHSQQHRKGNPVRTYLSMLTPQLMTRFFPAACLVGFVVDQLSDAERLLCRKGCSDDGELCVCIEGAAVSIERLGDGTSAHRRLWDSVAAFDTCSPTCKACATVVGRALMFIGRAADAHQHVWATADVLKAPGLVVHTRGGKRQRMSTDVRRMLVQDELQGGRAPTCSALTTTLSIGARSTAYRLVEKELAALQAASRLSNATPSTTAVCCDAAQIGKPSRDMLMIHMSCRGTGSHIVLPPKEHG